MKIVKGITRFYCCAGAFALLSALPVYASAASSYVDGHGNTYAATFNPHGAVLKSNTATLYLGRACDAYSPQHGKGTWGWANGGILVTFESTTIGFPRQEIEIDSRHKCLL
jgi:hypothetical protein